MTLRMLFASLVVAGSSGKRPEEPTVLGGVEVLSVVRLDRPATGARLVMAAEGPLAVFDGNVINLSVGAAVLPKPIAGLSDPIQRDANPDRAGGALPLPVRRGPFRAAPQCWSRRGSAARSSGPAGVCSCSTGIGGCCWRSPESPRLSSPFHRSSVRDEAEEIFGSFSQGGSTDAPSPARCRGGLLPVGHHCLLETHRSTRTPSSAAPAPPAGR